MEALSIYILEDEIITQRALKKCLQDYGYTVCGAQANAKKALEEIKTLQPDLVMLDIHVRGRETGIWLAEQISMPYIYLSAYTDKATIESASKTKPHAYLIKPFEPSQVFAAITVALKSFAPSVRKKSMPMAQHINYGNELIIKEGNLHVKIKPEEIDYFHTVDKYTSLYVQQKKFIMRSSLSTILSEHPFPFFIRVHKAYAINLHQIQSYSAGEISIGEKKIPLSRSYKNSFFEHMSNYKQL